uniref:Uncharacterized protein n=1 Tax=Nelumbo nucifera TaxID=4432 RepID=A0A822YLK0_NELNU|nr:TPA_asm: hypothetical protein HUJ06_012264 [Nelumbo nucifera]
MVFKGEVVKSVSFLLLSLAIFLTSSQAKPIIQQPQPYKSFGLKIQNTQSLRSCSYTVTIRTSCSSTSYTRDNIGLAFGDSYGN